VLVGEGTVGGDGTEGRRDVVVAGIERAVLVPLLIELPGFVGLVHREGLDLGLEEQDGVEVDLDLADLVLVDARLGDHGPYRVGDPALDAHGCRGEVRQLLDVGAVLDEQRLDRRLAIDDHRGDLRTRGVAHRHLAERPDAGELHLVGGQQAHVRHREAGLDLHVEAQVVVVPLRVGGDRIEDGHRGAEVEPGGEGDLSRSPVRFAAFGVDRRQQRCVGCLARRCAGRVVTGARRGEQGSGDEQRESAEGGSRHQSS
jgi:hypothetical protein